MRKYVPADKLKAEIERRIKENEALPHRYIRLDEDKKLLSLITSLQQDQPEVDLEKEYQEFCKDYPFPWSSQYINPEYIDELCLSIARHFAKWSAEHFRDSTKMVETPNDLEEAADEYVNNIAYCGDDIELEKEQSKRDFIAGVKWQKEQILKDNPVIMSVEDFQAFIDSHAKRVVEDYKEQIMKEAVEARVQTSPLNGPLGISAYCCNFPSKHPFYHCKEGDKVRVIVCEKEEYNETGKKL